MKTANNIVESLSILEAIKLRKELRSIEPSQLTASQKRTIEALTYKLIMSMSREELSSAHKIVLKRKNRLKSAA